MTPVAHIKALAATWRGRFILVFVLSQLLLPLHYYVGRRDPHDERFAWRMFSPMRMTGSSEGRCYISLICRLGPRLNQNPRLPNRLFSKEADLYPSKAPPATLADRRWHKALFLTTGGKSR